MLTAANECAEAEANVHDTQNEVERGSTKKRYRRPKPGPTRPATARPANRRTTMAKVKTLSRPKRWEAACARTRKALEELTWALKIAAAQLETEYEINGSTYPRVRYGAEDAPWDADRPCHDCLVVKGQLHVPGCDVERCPACGNQCISCECPE